MKPTLDLRSDESPDDFPDERRRQLQSRIDAMGPWFYDIDLPGGLRTRSKVAETHGGIHETRRRMLETALLAHFGDRLSETRAVDLGCHEGYFSFALRNLGVHDVVGVDLRDDNLARARLLAEHSQQGGVRFTKGNCEDLSALSNDGYDVVLMSGMMHRETPESCRRLLAKAFGALEAGGLVVVSDVFFDDEEKTSPPFSTLFALNMMLTSDHGSAHAQSEMADWTAEAGFTGVELAPFPPPMPHSMIQGVKP